MICPHCQNDTEKPATQPYITMKPTRIINLQITSWCPLCKKAKGYSGTLVMGDIADDAVSPVPEMCMCNLFNNNPQPLLPYYNTNASAILDYGGTITLFPVK